MSKHVNISSAKTPIAPKLLRVIIIIIGGVVRVAGRVWTHE